MPKSINKTYLVKLTTYAKEKAHGIGTTILIVFSVLLLLIGKVNETSLSIFKSYFLDITSGFLKILGKPVNSVSEGFYKINDADPKSIDDIIYDLMGTTEDKNKVKDKIEEKKRQLRLAKNLKKQHSQS